MTVRPIGEWPGKRTSYRKVAPFRQHDSGGTRKVPVGETLGLLRRELEMIGCRRAVIEAAFRDEDLRLDGWPKSSARTPGDPGVILRALDSKHGPLTYPCDTFTTWEDNLRAIALALEALRKVDRYGVTKSGEQYAGWKQIAASGTATLTAQAATAILVARDPRSAHVTSDIAVAMQREALKSRDKARDIYLAAAKATHPDSGGDTEAFQQVQSCRAVLAAHFGGAF